MANSRAAGRPSRNTRQGRDLRIVAARIPSGHEVNQGDGQRGSDNGPQDRKWMSIDDHRPQLRQAEGMGDRRTYERAEEPDRDRHDETASRAASDGSTDRTTDSCDEEQKKQTG
jgi:hypothetical protein